MNESRDPVAVRLDLPPVDRVLSDITSGVNTPVWVRRREEELDAARHAGFAEGSEFGRREVEAKLEIDRRRLNEQLSSVKRLIDALDEAIEVGVKLEMEEVVSLALELTSRLLGTDLVNREERILSVVGDAVASSPHRGPVRVVINPSVREPLEPLLAGLAGTSGREFEVHSDATLGSFDVVVEIGPQVFDGRVDAAFDRVLQELKGWK